MIDINEYKKFFEFVANKSGAGNNPTPQQFNTLTERPLNEWTMKRYGNEQQYRIGQPIPAVSYELTQKIMDDLRHLKEERQQFVFDGICYLPDGIRTDKNGDVMPDYLHLTALRSIYKYTEGNKILVTQYDIEIVKDKEWATRLNSKIIKPERKRPIGNVRNGYIQIKPETINEAVLTYLRQPYTPVWGYNMNENNRPIYDADMSTNIDAPKEAFNELIMMGLSYMGIHTREPELTQYSESMKAQGV